MCMMIIGFNVVCCRQCQRHFHCNFNFQYYYTLLCILVSSTSGYGNGVPHVVLPPGSNDNSIDETEIDTLTDIGVEKDVYRSKVS